MKNTKISFLMAAHNEERIIGRNLENLSNLPYDNYEIIIGLDGCTDKTEEIVKKFERKSGKIRHYNLNIRKGKPFVIDNIIKKSRGEIVIVIDADWIFKVENKRQMNEFVSIFKNEKIGGIAESFPVEWDENKIRGSNFGYKMVAYSSYFWFEYQKKRFAEKKDDLIRLKTNKMFLTNIFRRKLYKKNITLGDDFERTEEIMKRGYDVILFEKMEMPRMVAIYDEIPIRGLFKQKIRTGMAREQMNQLGRKKIGFWNYYLPAVWYLFFNSWKKSIYAGIATTAWIALTIAATFASKLRKKDTRKGWALRFR